MTDFEDLDLPPHGGIPDDVRARVRGVVRQRIHQPRRGVPVAVAAGVALFATAAVMVTTKSDAVVAPAQGGFDATMDRCWAAIKQQRKTADYPPRPAWRLITALESDEMAVLGLRSGTGAAAPFFCQATDMTVTVSKPATRPSYAEGARVAALLRTDNGVLAGVLDPAWPVTILATKPGSWTVLRPDRETGVFIVNPGGLDSTNTVTVQRAVTVSDLPIERPAAVEVPPAPLPDVTVVDRPGPPPPADSKGCQPHAGGLVPPVSFHGPGARLRQDAAQLAVYRGATWIGVCSAGTVDGQGAFRPGPPVSALRPGEPLAFATGRFVSKATLGGAVPVRTERMEIEFANGATAQAVVSNGTFAVVVPDGVPLAPGDEGRPAGPVTARLFDHAGASIYSGTLRQWDPPQ